MGPLIVKQTHKKRKAALDVSMRASRLIAGICRISSLLTGSGLASIQAISEAYEGRGGALSVN
jgi:hypothetical protein